MRLPDKTYDVLKWVALILLPACAWLYSTLAPIWGWYAPEQVATTITAIDTFLGVILGISTINYNKEGK